MNCQGFEEQISTYLDGELDHRQLQDFDQHRRECSLCAILLESVEENLAAFQSFPELDPPPALTVKILDATTRRPRGAAAFFRSLFPLEAGMMPRLAGAAVILLFGIALGYNLIVQPSSQLGSFQKEGTNLVTLVDYTGNRLFTRAVQAYQTVEEGWQTASNYMDRVNNFFRSNWEQVKSVLKEDEKPKENKKKDAPKDMNQSRQIHNSFEKTA